MDEREPKTRQHNPPEHDPSGRDPSGRDPSGHDPSGHAGAQAAPVAVADPAVAPSVDQAEAPFDPGRQSSHVVYSDTEQGVMKGFAIALRAMGLG